MSRKTSLIILILTSLAVHFAFFGHPKETVFDEVHFGKFVSAYYTHEYYFDIHPPGGKLIIAGFAKLFNFSPEYSFAEIGQQFPDHKYLALRFLPSLAGTLLPIVIYLLALGLGFSLMASFSAGMLVALENALLTQSRYLLLDPFLLLFGFSALLFYVIYRRTNRLPYLFLMAIAGGLAMSIKWTGLTFLGMAGVIELWNTARTISLKRIINLIIYFTLTPLVLYFAIFTIHFSLLKNSGNGDAFMTPEFQSTLNNSSYSSDPTIKPLNDFQKFIELNKEMYTANKTLTATHPYSSKWYTWPLMIRPIYYWNNASNITPDQEKIYLIGNPLIWWASSVAVLYLLLSLFGRNFLKEKLPLLLLAGYLINFLPFIGIGRVMFLYHYLSSLIFAILILVYLIDTSHRPKTKFLVLILLAISTFVYFAPLSYGLHLEAKSFQNHLWLKTWQ
ncbi:MAG: phospholipid carrier-dependent glycosyltransferase [Patescibacteria group bacterium]